MFSTIRLIIVFLKILLTSEELDLERELESRLLPLLVFFFVSMAFILYGYFQLD
ncbi:MAG: hypothetical protein AAFP76_17210 [Bacteroidota bacterium]